MSHQLNRLNIPECDKQKVRLFNGSYAHPYIFTSLSYTSINGVNAMVGLQLVNGDSVVLIT
jgi:hypothetical protein